MLQGKNDPFKTSYKRILKVECTKCESRENHKQNRKSTKIQAGLRSFPEALASFLFGDMSNSPRRDVCGNIVPRAIRAELTRTVSSASPKEALGPLRGHRACRAPDRKGLPIVYKHAEISSRNCWT